ncbi:hypothetical protein RchiOBHm_Chr6g0277021 [Rosa chinensis]|uniref:Uncharacterized protein n=1 Tax=Rosa chinensis TaxID=74649 RepID=A0A2P6PSG9_ROSCH|nr:hypothetical protein RchiOBHm_Chr6g0277021 [Rosa chinensis]
MRLVEIANLEVLLHRNLSLCCHIPIVGDFCGEQLLSWVLHVAFPTRHFENRLALWFLNSLFRN